MLLMTEQRDLTKICEAALQMSDIQFARYEGRAEGYLMRKEEENEGIRKETVTL